MSYKPETPFDSIESAQQFVGLLIEAIEDSRRDVDADIELARNSRSKRYKQALQIVSNNLAELSQHMATSNRILKNLRSLRRLLLSNPETSNHYADYSSGSDYSGQR